MQEKEPRGEGDEQSAEILSPMEQLDDYSLESIFKKLTPDARLEIEPVCQRWKSLNRSISWGVRGLYYPYIEPDQNSGELSESLTDLKQRFTYAPRSLELSGQYIKELDLSAFTDSTILTKLKKVSLPQLIILKLRVLSRWQPQDCDNLFEKMTKLESLHLTRHFCCNMPINFFKALSVRAETLKELSLINLSNYMYAYNSSHHESLAESLSLLAGFKSLRLLELDGYSIRQVDIESLVKSDLNLEILIINRCTVLQEMDLFYILLLPSLRKIALHRCREDFTWAFLMAMPIHLKDLTELMLCQPNVCQNILEQVSNKCQITVTQDTQDFSRIINTWKNNVI